jgi:DNA repair protein RadC
MEQYRTFDVEVLSMISLESSNEFKAFTIINSGEPGSVTVSVRKIVEKAISTGANSVILAHNHPSGIAIPSQADIEATINVKKLLDQMGIHLIDHIILDKQDFVSMAQSSEYSHIF